MDAAVTNRCRVHSWTIPRVTALHMVDAKGWPTGWFQVQETKLCAACTSFETRYVPGARSRSPQQALELYREQQAALSRATGKD